MPESLLSTPSNLVVEAAVPQAEQPAPAPAAVPPTTADGEPFPTIPEILQEIEDAHLSLRRAAAGYARLDHVYRTLKTELRPGELKAAPPILSFSATVTGREAETLHLDLKHVPKEELEWLLVPMVHGFAAQLVAAQAHLAEYLDLLRVATHQVS